MWNADGSGTPIVLRGHHRELTNASFSPDGTRIVTASNDHTARVWLMAAPLLRDLVSSATTACIPADDRTFYLGETLDEAHEHFTACELTHHRSAPTWD